MYSILTDGIWRQKDELSKNTEATRTVRPEEAVLLLSEWCKRYEKICYTSDTNLIRQAPLQKLHDSIYVGRNRLVSKTCPLTSWHKQTRVRVYLKSYLLLCKSGPWRLPNRQTTPSTLMDNLTGLYYFDDLISKIDGRMDTGRKWSTYCTMAWLVDKLNGPIQKNGVAQALKELEEEAETEPNVGQNTDQKDTHKRKRNAQFED